MTSPFVGSWSYRSFQNNPDLAVPFNALRFGAGTLALTAAGWFSVGVSGKSPESCDAGSPGRLGGSGESGTGPLADRAATAL